MSNETTRVMMRLKYQMVILSDLRRSGTGLTRDAIRRQFAEPEQAAVLFVLDEMAERGWVKLDGDAHAGGVYAAVPPKRPRPSLGVRSRCEDGEDYLPGNDERSGGRGYE